MHIEQRPRLAGQIGRQALAARAQLLLHGRDCGLEGGLFGGEVSNGAIRYRGQIGQRVEEGEGADRHARSALDPLDKGAPWGRPVQQPGDLLHGGGIVDDFGQPGRECDETSRFLRVEQAFRPSPCHQHPQSLAIIDQRDAEEGVVDRFPGFSERTTARMSRRIFQIDQFLAFADPPDEAFLLAQADLADQTGVQAIRRHQDILTAFLLEEVNGARIDREGLFDPTNNNGQSLVQIAGGLDFLDDASWGDQH